MEHTTKSTGRLKWAVNNVYAGQDCGQRVREYNKTIPFKKTVKNLTVTWLPLCWQRCEGDTHGVGDGAKPCGTGFGFKQNKVIEKMKICACQLGRNYTELTSAELRAIIQQLTNMWGTVYGGIHGQVMHRICS